MSALTGAMLPLRRCSGRKVLMAQERGPARINGLRLLSAFKSAIDYVQVLLGQELAGLKQLQELFRGGRYPAAIFNQPLSSLLVTFDNLSPHPDTSFASLQFGEVKATKVAARLLHGVITQVNQNWFLPPLLMRLRASSLRGALVPTRRRSLRCYPWRDGVDVVQWRGEGLVCGIALPAGP
jgi:hypothetical protein